jgi:hypothetical protein
MKAFLPPILLLAVILTAAAVNCRTMETLTCRWSDELEQVDALADAGDWELAGAGLEAGYRDWSKSQSYLHIVVRHEEVDGAEAMYRRAAAFAQTQELSEFRAELADLRSQLLLIAEMEQVNARNIL